MLRQHVWLSRICWTGVVVAAAITLRSGAQAQDPEPEMLDPSLQVRTVIDEDLEVPIGMAFVAPGDMLVLEKNSGQVKRVQDGFVTGTVLDLGVNNASERGLLSIALHPDFPSNPGVYLFWTCRSTAAPANPFFPDEETCLDANMFADDSGNVLEVPLLGNRVDRFEWDGSSLTFDQNLIMLRAFQNDGAPVPAGQGDETQTARGNHNGGVIRFGPDRMLYIQVGDVGRRGQLQNLEDGPGGPTRADDQFGGPEPDNAHFTSVILRLDENGNAPPDNPFFSAGAGLEDEEIGGNVQKIFAYGLRNGFGMAFDPKSGALWEQENGDDSFSELNLVEPGFNSGWIQIMGPPERIAEYKAIETTVTPMPPDPFTDSYFGLQQLRWSPENIADTAEEALGRLFMLPGAHYSAPEFAWKFEVAPGAIGFASRSLGPQFDGDLFVAAARPFLEGGHLFSLQLTGNRRMIGVDDPRLEDRVADNRHKWEITESESLLIGRNFGIGTDMLTGPNGSLFMVSLSRGAIYEIFGTPRGRGRR